MPFNFSLDSKLVTKWFRECTPKILVITDTLNFRQNDDFGLTEFVETLRTSTVHSMTPSVRTATFNPAPQNVLSFDAATNHITNFKFADASFGLLKSRYDVVFLFGSGGLPLTNEPGALGAITAFMQAGGGLFCTGDHAILGANLCKDIPRARNMRLWTVGSGVPSAGGTNRLTTNLPGRGDVVGSNDTYEFNDQSDRFPQRLFVNFRTNAGGTDRAHPLLQVPGANRAIEVFPDHPHEGECVIPKDLTTKLADGITDEWPASAAGTRISPEMVALTMSHGNAIPSHGKASVVPRSFIAICAYDGHATNVGRVTTDATWHHFVNINVQPAQSDVTGRDLADIKQYYVNLATWLMPKNVRLCLRYPWLIKELVRFPLFEELVLIPRPEWDGPRLLEVGRLVEQALLSKYAHAEVNSLIHDALEEGSSAETRRKLDALKDEVVGISVREAGLAALGALVQATVERVNTLHDAADVAGEKAFAGIGKESSAVAVKLFISDAQKRLKQVGTLISAFNA